MNALSIARANMRQRRLATILTMMLVAIGLALVHAILTIKSEVQAGFNRGVAGKVHAIVGPKGSPMQLVLNSLFHVSKPVGNLNASYYENVIKDHPRVKLAIPMAVGDNYQGYHIVGTIPEFLTELELANSERFRFAAGKPFSTEWQAVLGSEAARTTGLGVGDHFHAEHGVVESHVEENVHKEGHFDVVGVLAPTGTPHDRAVYCTLKSVYDLHENQKAVSEGKKPLSAILVVCRAESWIGPFVFEINNGPDAMAAIPSIEIRDLMKIVGNVDRVLVAISWLVLFAAGVSILVSIYNSMSDRRREIAIIRALGAPASTVFNLIVIEAAAICLIGGVVGLAVSHAAILLGRDIILATAGVPIGAGGPDWVDLYLLAGALGIGIVSSLIPAFSAYRTDVATNLRPVA
jgi:putative ABC transport system permease protein